MTSPRPRPIRSAYLAPESLERTLEAALLRQGVTITAWHGRLALSSDQPVSCPWAQDTWTAPTLHQTPSIKSAADALRAQQRNWSNYTPPTDTLKTGPSPTSLAHHRRTALIQARLPPVKAAPLQFPAAAPTAHLGAWTLLEANILLASPTKSSPFPNGECKFIEDRTGPPSRAYLKLWEALTRMGVHPGPGQTCLDLGAAPGGWTWALAQLGAKVESVDKAPLAPAIAALPNVTQTQENAFALEPRPIDWLVCDIIAYPARTLALLEQWRSFATQIVCTIKFQGDTDHDLADRIAALPGLTLAHLSHNKHELTAMTRTGCNNAA